MIRLLAISPRFAPVNGADTHRLRLLLNHAAARGWQVEVLAVRPEHVVGPVDPWLEEQLPDDIVVHKVPSWRLRGWGLNGLAQRSIWPLYWRGAELLDTGRFDLVFFSTTEFPLHLLGPLWHRNYGVPFCMDYQDPWVNDYYRDHPAVMPPGGRVKFSVAHALNRVMEKIVVSRCAGFMAVSRVYLEEIERRYGSNVTGKPALVKPFPAEPAELNMLGIRSEFATSENAPKIWRYIGRGGPDMVKAAAGFVRAWQQSIRQSKLFLDYALLEATGTSYAADGHGEKTYEPLVADTELAPQVRENPNRLGYSDMLRALLSSDALIVFGSDDPAYTASKIYPYLMAGKPLLAIFHEQSSVVGLMREAGGGVCVTFNEQTTLDELASEIVKAWFAQHQYERPIALNQGAFEPYTARAQAQDVAEWFRAILRRAI